ncbi:MAG: hypothetical protein MEBIL_04186 [Bilophila sp.]
MFEIRFQIARVRHLHDFPVLEIRRGEDFFPGRVTQQVGVAAVPVSLSPEMERYRFAARGVHAPHHHYTVGILSC